MNISKGMYEIGHCYYLVSIQIFLPIPSTNIPIYLYTNIPVYLQTNILFTSVQIPLTGLIVLSKTVLRYKQQIVEDYFNIISYMKMLFRIYRMMKLHLLCPGTPPSSQLSENPKICGFHIH
ncbi:hypothetical protein C2G38_2174600 [Gigaspora rosea]|uniref:Uncharacterized protein n=1 Tax=Gigaspora rosea TaxID=44941 RepID=A0A397VI75_9GLOM|nr:hypothetical protein C2G38_2174600 [Gigaspora rosea]